MLYALSPVRDASSGVSRVDDVALVASGAMKRLISIFSGAAGLSWGNNPHGTSGVFIKREGIFSIGTFRSFGFNTKGGTIVSWVCSP